MRAIAFVLLLPALAFGSDWKPVQGTSASFDKESLTRKDDRVTAWVKVTHDSRPIRAIADCSLRTIRVKWNEDEAVVPDSPDEKVYNALCKKSYEFWK